MQIHELNNFTGTLGAGSYVAIDDGNDTGKVSTQQILANTEARIDNIIAGEAPSAAEVTDARYGADGVTYTSLGTAIRTQFTDVKSDLVQTQTNYIKCESGTYANGQKQPSVSRIRNVSPISVRGCISITIPVGYEAYVQRLDKTKAYISSHSLWVNGKVAISSIITDDTKYIDLIIKDSSDASKDISGYTSAVSDGLILTSIDDSLAVAGVAPDSKKVGDEIAKLTNDVGELRGIDYEDRMTFFNSLPVCETEEGAYIYIGDGAEGVPIEKASLKIEPRTDGIVPTVYRTGKNLLPLTLSNIKTRNTEGVWDDDNNTYSFNGITYTINLNDKGQVISIEADGTATADAPLWLMSFFDYLKEGVSYIISGCPADGSLETYSLRWVTTNFDNASSDIGLGLGSTLLYDNDWTRVYIEIKSGTTLNKTFRPIIRYATESDATFEPYFGDSYTMNLPADTPLIYGGRIDAVKKVANVTYESVDLGTMHWVYEPTGSYTRFYSSSLQGHVAPPLNNDSVANLLCNAYDAGAVNEIFGLGKDRIVASSATGVISISDSRYTDVNDFVSAVTGTNLVYEKKTETDFTFEAEKATTLRGFNNIWSNADTISVAYHADPVLYESTFHYDFAERYKKYNETSINQYLTVGLPILYLSGDISSMTKEVTAKLTYKYKNNSGKCTLKWQGASSIQYQKKNYTIKFGNSITVLDEWGSHKKYVLKANYIDPTHARNVVACKLWGQIVRSRSVENPYLHNLVNGGAIDGFPVIVVLNGMFHGLYTFNIPKDDWMFGMSGSSEYEGIISAETHSQPTRFKETISTQDLEEETSFSVEYASDDSDISWMATSLSQAITSVMNATGADDKDVINQYVDIDSAIDYYIFICLILGIDCTDKNYLLSTFDGTKWYFTVYDLDSIMGLHWAGGRYLPSTEEPTFHSFAVEHLLMRWIYRYDTATLKARYNELRSSVLSVNNVTNMFYNFGIQIPRPIKDMEYERWNLIPATDTSDISQIVNWYKERVEVMDAEIESL